VTATFNRILLRIALVKFQLKHLSVTAFYVLNELQTNGKKWITFEAVIANSCCFAIFILGLCKIHVNPEEARTL